MNRRHLLVLLLVALGAISSIAAKPVTCPIGESTDFVYYGGRGASSVSQSWMNHFLEWWQVQDSRIEYMELSATQVKSCQLQDYPDLDLYIQPGGDAYQQQKTLGATGRDSIISYLDSGGAYFGACAGFFYTASDYFWQDKYYAHANLMGVYPATVEGSIREIADWDVAPSYAVTPLSNGRNALYYGGPTLGYEYTSLGDVAGTVDATFTAHGNGMPAVVRWNKMLLTSVHLEAFEEDGFTGLSTADRIENYKYLANLINETAETDFYVPPYAEPPTPKQCQDGVDNDGDGAIDMDDSGCASPTDDDETDPLPGPQLIFADGFESGDLSAWVVYGPGAPWIVSTESPNQGSFAAIARKSGAGDPTYLEREIDLSGYSIGSLEYRRKLVGLDRADEFSAEYFDGGWNLLEATGKRSERNDDYIQRSYAIPNSATKIRFQCMAGAVSEWCLVDDVTLSGQ